MNKIILCALATLSIFVCSQSFSANPEYVESFDIAQKEAKEQNKKILAIFGADWCKYCLDLKKDIESSKGDTLLDDFVVCYIDYDKNPEIARRYKVTRLPSSCIISNNRYTKIEGYSSFSSYQSLINSRK